MDKDVNNQDEVKTLTQELMKFGRKMAEAIEALGETPTAKKLSSQLNQYLEEFKVELSQIRQNPSEEIKAKAVQATKRATEEIIKGLQKINTNRDETIKKMKDKDETNSDD